MIDVNVFVANETLISPDVYDLWIGGYSAYEASSIQQKRGDLQHWNATFEMLLSDTQDQYRTAFRLEPHLQNPVIMHEQQIFQISPENLNFFIEKYYSFNDTFIREILGKKLSSRTRNNLDDVSEKTRIPLRSCRRQYDNLKQVCRIVEDMPGSLITNIQTHFLLSDTAAERYAALVFITNNRFETSKKKLNYLVLNDFIYCANLIIKNWTCSNKEIGHHEDMNVDIDREFLYGLRDVKSLADREHVDVYRSAVFKIIKSESQFSHTAMNDLESNFRSISKSLINVAYGLNHSKELRDLFLDLVEKIIEPCKAALWSLKDLQIFLKIFTETSSSLEFFKTNVTIYPIWERFLHTITACILRMFHN